MGGSGGWWGLGAALGVAAWVAARGPVQKTVVERRKAHDLPTWVVPAGWLFTVAVAAVVFGVTDRRAELPAIACYAISLVWLGLIDAATLTLPRQLVWVALAAGVAGLSPIALADGESGRIGRTAIGAAVAVGVVWVLRVVTRRGIGFGDVRLAAPIGWFSAWVSWDALGRAGLLAVVINGVVSALLLATRRAGRRSRVPFGPSMAAGALIVILMG